MMQWEHEKTKITFSSKFCKYLPYRIDYGNIVILCDEKMCAIYTIQFHSIHDTRLETKGRILLAE